ncbi:MAG: acetylglutamate kinase [Bacteroidota bacterium]
MTTATFKKEDVLIEALPYIQQYEGKTFVVKYGGAVMEDDKLKTIIAKDVTLLKKIGINIVVIHGGGKEITSLSNRLNLQTKFVNGQRYTDGETLNVVQMVLAGSINKEIVRRINMYGGRAVGISGIDGEMIKVKKYQKEDIGLVGEVIGVNETLINNLLKDGYLPVIAPLGVDANGTVYNVNADIAAGSIAGAIDAAKLVYMSDTEGVKINNELVPHLTEKQIVDFINNGIINGGMIPKVESALNALNSGVSKVHIIDGRIEHALLLEIFTEEGIGTEIVRG